MKIGIHSMSGYSDTIEVPDSAFGMEVDASGQTKYNAVDLEFHLTPRGIKTLIEFVSLGDVFKRIDNPFVINEYIYPVFRRGALRII